MYCLCILVSCNPITRLSADPIFFFLRNKSGSLQVERVFFSRNMSGSLQVEERNKITAWTYFLYVSYHMNRNIAYAFIISRVLKDLLLENLKVGTVFDLARENSVMFTVNVFFLCVCTKIDRFWVHSGKIASALRLVCEVSVVLIGEYDQILTLYLTLSPSN